MRKEIIEKIEALQKNEDTKEVASSLKDLKEDFYNVARIEAEKQLEKFLEEGGNRADFERPKDEIDARFKELLDKLNERIRSYRERLKQEQLQNFDKKTELLNEISSLKEEEHIGKALTRIKQIQEEWKSIGSVPKEKAKTVASEYSQKLDEFYYGIKIYSELQEHDFKKNIELRKEIISKIKELEKQKAIKELQMLLPAYQADWDQQGPVLRAEWDALRDEYWQAVRAIQDRIKKHFSDVKEKHQANLERKKEIIERVEQKLAALSQINKASKWDKATQEVLAMQAEWKKAGFAGKKVNDEVWKAFRSACDAFFKAKEDFFSELKDELKDVKARKLALIKQVSEIKDNTNWRDTSKKIQQIQQQWKRSGNLLRGEEQKLWNAFRAECDHFFNKKKEWFAGLDERKANNLKEKTAYLDALEKFKTERSGEDAAQELRDAFKKFYDIGPVPEADATALLKRFRNIQKSLSNQLGINASELQELQYKVKLDRMGDDENPEESLDNERRDLERQMKTIDSEKIQYENNLGFFQYVADDNPMKKEVLEKIQDLQNKKAACLERIKLIKTEMRKLKQEESQ